MTPVVQFRDSLLDIVLKLALLKFKSYLAVVEHVVLDYAIVTQNSYVISIAKK